jgi:hypothetical protein
MGELSQALIHERDELVERLGLALSPTSQELSDLVGACRHGGSVKKSREGALRDPSIGLYAAAYQAVTGPREPVCDGLSLLGSAIHSPTSMPTPESIMSGGIRITPLRRLSRASTAALGTALLLQAIACHDTSRVIAPTAADHTSLAKSPGPASGIVLGAPVFGLDIAPNGTILAAVASAGVVSIRDNTTDLLGALLGVNAVASLGSGEAFAVTGGSTDPSQILPTSRKLFRVARGRVREVADLWEYEQAINPDQFWNTSPVPVESNPFDVVSLGGGRVLVADAAANDILVVDANGRVDWVAVLTPASTPGPEPVPTSIAVGPDGAYYVGELTGFPATPGLSRVWRIAPGSRHVICPSAACTLVRSGFTSIMDLEFGPDGTLYVVEFDEASWLGVEANGFAKTDAGGTVNACNVNTKSCSVVATGLSLPTAITVGKTGARWIVEHLPMLFASARVRQLQSVDQR